MLTNGARLGPYEVVSAAGAGGMGEVYKARDTRLDRIVALKILPPGRPRLGTAADVLMNWKSLFVAKPQS